MLPWQLLINLLIILKMIKKVLVEAVNLISFVECRGLLVVKRRRRMRGFSIMSLLKGKHSNKGPREVLNCRRLSTEKRIFLNYNASLILSSRKTIISLFC